MGYPIQDGDNIPEWLAAVVYNGYVAQYGNQQSYETIRERGGFGKSEVVWCLNCLGIKRIEHATAALKKESST